MALVGQHPGHSLQRLRLLSVAAKLEELRMEGRKRARQERDAGPLLRQGYDHGSRCGGDCDLLGVLGLVTAGFLAFIAPPEKQLGQLKYGPSIMNIQGDRSQVGGLSTIGWDDDGVKPDEFLIVKNGMFNDYQTTREQAPWLRWWYDKNGTPVRSHGCSHAWWLANWAYRTPCGGRSRPAFSIGQEWPMPRVRPTPLFRS